MHQAALAALDSPRKDLELGVEKNIRKNNYEPYGSGGTCVCRRLRLFER